MLTNYHVVQGAGSISVTVAQTGQTYQATVVGIDPAEDVALIQLTGASGLTTIKPDTDAVNIGEQVTAVGNAGGTGTLSAATGEITGLDASVTAGSEDGSAPETLGGMLETNANVVAGDSGGPPYDAQGEVVGIDTAGSTGGAPDAYAIPIAVHSRSSSRSSPVTRRARCGSAPPRSWEYRSPALPRMPAMETLRVEGSPRHRELRSATWSAVGGRQCRAAGWRRHHQARRTGRQLVR